jgi:hypothetical protein
VFHPIRLRRSSPDEVFAPYNDTEGWRGRVLIRTVQLLRNIGTFDSVNAGAQLVLNKVALMYAENGRGKTTLAAALS